MAEQTQQPSSMQPFQLASFVSDLIQKLGPTTVLIGILFSALMGWIPTPLTRTLDVLEKQTMVLQQHDANSSSARREQSSATLYQNMLLRTICRGIVPAQNQSQCEPRYMGWEEKEGR
jgi:F420-0:gamma-glutamyl ligase-like protein